ncbi:MAG: fructose-6-phosphate aldolase [Candidatus Kerfeldbacteria bacterium]|nr:fructose-6-phosphate aldolase [Candidatus Kerfeldbacteria bacterium]
MKYFLDTADIEAIKKAASTGVLDGITTNPSLIVKSGRKFEDVIREIAGIVDGPISAEVTALDTAGMLEQSRPLIAIHPNIVIKVPMTEAGIAACAALSKQHVRVNVTLIFDVNQAMLAAHAGATFASPFCGRLDDIGQDGVKLVEEIVKAFRNYKVSTQVLAASIRSADHVRRCALAGADVVTVPPQVFHELFSHPLTDAGIEKFLNDWKSAVK